MNNLSGSGRPTLHVVHVLRAPLGGLFRHVCDLVQEQERAGMKTGVICATPNSDPVTTRHIAELNKNCSLGLHIVDMPRMPGIGDFKTLRHITPIIRAIAPDIVHGHGAKGGAYARLLPRAAGGLRIYTPHGGALHYSLATPQGFAFLLAEKLLSQRTDGFIFESEFSHRAFQRKVGPTYGRAAIVHNGIAPDEFEEVKPEPDAADFLFIGELRQLKGVSTLIDAASLVGAPIHIRIVGSGPERALFERQASQASSNVRIDFLGSMPARRAFALARAVVLPSHHESLPYVALEAAGANIPLIATRVGGLPEIFGKFSSRLVMPRNAAALAMAMREAMLQPEVAMQLASALRSRIMQEFSLTGMATGVSDFYADLLAASHTYQSAVLPEKGHLEHEVTP